MTVSIAPLKHFVPTPVLTDPVGQVGLDEIWDPLYDEGDLLALVAFHFSRVLGQEPCDDQQADDVAPFDVRVVITVSVPIKNL